MLDRRTMLGRFALFATALAIGVLTAGCGEKDTSPYPFTQTREGHDSSMSDEERERLQDRYKAKVGGG